MKKIILSIAGILLFFVVISFASTHPVIKTKLIIANEKGNPISANIESSHNTLIADGKAEIELKNGPDNLLISAKGYLPEIVPIGWNDDKKTVNVKLLPDTNRIVINFGGDVMLGRRYLEIENPTNTKNGALNIVKNLSRAFSAADISCINFESIIGNLNKDEAYDGKRFLLQSPPESIDALKSLGVDLVCLANNHIKDWENKGVDSTLNLLANAGIQTVGAGTEKTSRAPAIIEKKGVKIGTLAYTTVTGSFVNKFEPLQLQNWVATNDEKGAAQWITDESTKEIADLKKKTNLLIVQLHSGFQFKTAPSAAFINAAHAAIDAGADIVIGHHPHVLQGMEWYKGHLIVYSLGNLIFDQNFLDTFSSGFLRTVWEGNKLIEARFIPLEIIDYKPAVVTDISANQIINQVWEESVIPAQTKRHNNYVYTIQKPKDADSKPVQFILEHNTARLTSAEHMQNCTINLKQHETLNLDNNCLYPADLSSKNKINVGQVYIGRDLLKWGHLEDTSADEQQTGALHFDLKEKGKWINNENDSTGFIRLMNSSNNTPAIIIRPVARIPLINHRLYNELYDPIDPDPSYSIRMAVKGKGEINASVRIDSYWFYDANPTEDPQTELLSKKEYPIDVKTDSWQTIEIPFIPSIIDGKKTNAIMVYVKLSAPSKNRSFLDIDNIEVIEWRDVSRMPSVYGAYTHIKNTDNPINIQCNVLTK